MFLLMATSEIFLLLGWVWRSDCLCSPTTFFKNCWIRRFPGLAIDLENSQRKGAHVIKVYTNSTAQQCSQTCCLLKNVSCNLAVFYYETNNQNRNCLSIYCPALESCILKPMINVVLYNITAGIDPDLLVFEKLSFKDMTTRSSFNKWERHGSVRVADSEKCQDATTTSKDLPPKALSAVVQELKTNSKTTSTTGVPMYKTAPTVYIGPTVASVKGHFTKVTDIISGKNSSRATSVSTTALPSYAFTSLKMLSHLPSMAYLNNSKHLNETKGYGGRNYTSDDQGQKPAWEGVERKTWLLPVMLCSSLILICCCSIFLATGCHRKRHGHYKPRRRGVSVYRQK
ncbi:MANSC domain-containing protein 4 [Sceloporus undulatus]|uniref:MANSC domain-containing protein 4 n=1 Tax=Sceloporus undulatus TaxID=8520 RepID=UPI001C4C6D02|nr:MANSC domain-containing protein 4 [Sceloporus undulatus]